MSRTAAETLKKLTSLPAGDFLQAFSSLGKGNANGESLPGGGISADDLASLKPDGKTAVRLGELEQRAYSARVGVVRVAILEALPGAIAALGGLSRAPSCPREALSQATPETIFRPEGNDLTWPKTLVEAYRLLERNLEHDMPTPALMKEKREAILLLFTLAKDWGVLGLAEAHRGKSEQAEIDALVRQAERDLDDEE